MAAKDYQICFGLDGAYVAKVEKDGSILGKDKRRITEEAIMALIVWWVRRRLKGTENRVTEISINGKPVVELELLET